LVTKAPQQPVPSSSLERVAYTVPEFCFRNSVSRAAYQRLRSQGRGPVEMRLGLNLIRITAEAERAWQQAMQEPNAELEQQAVARAAKAGHAASKSPMHVSNTRRQATAARSRAKESDRMKPCNG
jgi:hypothetical protein